VPVSIQKSERSCIFVLGISTLLPCFFPQFALTKNNVVQNIKMLKIHEIIYINLYMVCIFYLDDSYRPFLMSYERSRNSYINAVIIPVSLC